MIDYDDGDPSKKRTIFITESDAKSQADPFPYYGEIVDYRNSITPVIGKVKPSNFLYKKEVLVLTLIVISFYLKVVLLVVLKHIIVFLNSLILILSSLLKFY